MKNHYFKCTAMAALLLLGTSAYAGNSTPTMNETCTVTGINYQAWQYAQIPANYFISDATSAEVTIKGAVFVAFGYAVNQWNYQDYSDGIFNWSESNKAGITYTVAGDVLSSAKNGGLYFRTNTSSDLTMTIKNIGQSKTADVTPADTTTDVTTTDTVATDTTTTDVTPTDTVTTDTTTTDTTTTDTTPTDTTTTDTTDTTSTEEQVYGILSSYEMTLSEWNNINIPASAFNANAEDVKLIVSGASYVKYIDGSTTIAEYPWSDDTKYGAILNLTADQIAEGVKGNLYTWVGGGTSIKLTVACYGMGGVVEALRDRDSLDLTNYADLSYAIANKYQLTDVPTLYLTIPDAEGKDLNTVLFKDRSTNTADYHDVTVQVVDENGSLEEFTDDGEIKVRGNSTAECAKRPYRIKFPKKHKHDMLGQGYSERNWVLLANYLDPAMIRNGVSYHIGKEVGMEFCPGYQYADVVINNEYRGTYQITDQVEVGKKRINVDEDNGWYIEVSRIDMIEDPCMVAGGLPLSIKNPEPEDSVETVALKAEVEEWFDNLSTVFKSDNSTFTDPDKGWRAYLDEESLVNYYIGVNIAGDYDGFMTVKMFREADGKMHFGPLWDKDLSAGNYEDGSKLIEEYNNGAFVNYLNVLLTDPGFVKSVQTKLASLVAGGLEDNLQSYVTLIDGKIAQTEPLNNTKWNSYSSWKQSFTTHADAIQQLRDYYASHVSFVTEKIDEKVAALGSSAKGNTYTAIANVRTDVAVLAGKGTLTVACNDGGIIPVYSMTGVEIARPVSGMTISLPAGAYIVGGYKVIVK